jgi:hypothetical protein
VTILIVIGVLVGAAIVFSLYWTVSSELIWASRIRQLLAQAGFSVRRMERRWLTRGPFPDLTPPGLKHHKEWLVRVVAEDAAHHTRAGWVRWHRRRPWESADAWAVHWDQVPWSGEWDGAQAKGLSTRVFFIAVHGLAAAATLAAVFLVVPAMGLRYRESVAPAETTHAPAPQVYEIRCRGGFREAFRIEQLGTETRRGPNGDVLAVRLSLRFATNRSAAGVDGSGLAPGTCAWLDRPLNASEPPDIRFDTAGVRAPDPPHAVVPAPGTVPDAEYMSDPTHYWSFQVFNFNAGFLQATGPGRPVEGK